MNECLRSHVSEDGEILSSSCWELRKFSESAAPLAWDESDVDFCASIVRYIHCVSDLAYTFVFQSQFLGEGYSASSQEPRKKQALRGPLPP